MFFSKSMLGTKAAGRSNIYLYISNNMIQVNAQNKLIWYIINRFRCL